MDLWNDEDEGGWTMEPIDGIVDSLERTRISWDGDGTVVIDLVENGEVTLTRSVTKNGDGSLTVVSEPTSRKARTDLLISLRKDKMEAAIAELEKLDEDFAKERALLQKDTILFSNESYRSNLIERILKESRKKEYSND